jgi:hypothetical protein
VRDRPLETTSVLKASCPPGDDDAERRTQGEVLLNAYNRELERRRLAAGARGVALADEGIFNELVCNPQLIYWFRSEGEEYDDDDESGDEFHYPGASPAETPRPSSAYTQGADYFNQLPAIRALDLTPALSQASEFRVPTHEAPQKVLTPRWMAPTPHQLHAQWERDDNVSACRDCGRRFNFLLRRVCDLRIYSEDFANLHLACMAISSPTASVN